MIKEGHEDEIHIITDIKLSWVDRLKVLLRGELSLKTRTQVEHAPGRLETVSRVSVPPFWIRKPPAGMGMAEFSPSARP